MTDQIVVLTIDQSPLITNANAPFESPDADAILHSSDKVDFRVFKMFLAFVSPIFKDIFALPRGSGRHSTRKDEMKDGLPIIQMAENSGTVENLLKFCHPIPISKAPVFNVLDDAIALWEAADKYEMYEVMNQARGALLTPPLIDMRIFAIVGIDGK